MNIRRLSLLGSVFLSGLLTLGACGSSSSSGTGGTTGSVGGSNGTVGGHVGSNGGGTGTGATGGQLGSVGGSTGTGGAGGSGTTSCPNTAVPSCLQAFQGCLPAGTCVMQTTGSVQSLSLGSNSCYSNGVKTVITETVTATGEVTVTSTVSKNGTVCFSEVVSGTAADPNPVISVKNGAGTTVATVTNSADGNSSVVTCTGGTPVVLPDGCDFSGVMDMTTGDCTDGVCQ